MIMDAKGKPYIYGITLTEKERTIRILEKRTRGQKKERK